MGEWMEGKMNEFIIKGPGNLAKLNIFRQVKFLVGFHFLPNSWK